MKTNMKTLIDAKPFHFRFDKIDWFIRVYDETRYLALFESQNYDFIYNRIKYLINAERSITFVISHNYSKIKADSYDSLPLEKATTFNNAVILVRSVFNKDKNKCYYHIFSEKTSMTCYDRIDFSEGIDVNERSELKEWDICRYWYFLN